MEFIERKTIDTVTGLVTVYRRYRQGDRIIVESEIRRMTPQDIDPGVPPGFEAGQTPSQSTDPEPPLTTSNIETPEQPNQEQPAIDNPVNNPEQPPTTEHDTEPESPTNDDQEPAVPVQTKRRILGRSHSAKRARLDQVVELEDPLPSTSGEGQASSVEEDVLIVNAPETCEFSEDESETEDPDTYEDTRTFILMDTVGEFPDDSDDTSSQDSVVTCIPNPAVRNRPGSTGGNVVFCSICQTTVHDIIGRHFEAHHLPWWLHPGRFCWECKSYVSSLSRLHLHHAKCRTMNPGDTRTWAHLCNGLLRLLREDLGCHDNTELLQLIVDRGYYPQPRQRFNLSMEQKLAYRTWEMQNGLQPTPLEDYRVQPPTAVACLLHRKVLATVMGHLQQTTVARILNLGERMAEEAPPGRIVLPRAVDAHIHLDRMMPRYQQRLGSVQDTQLRFSALVANFINPPLWDQWRILREDPTVYATFGIHPARCTTIPNFPELRVRLVQYLTSPRCVGLGEIGLDYRPGQIALQRENQRHFFKAMLRLRPAGLPVVLHYRGRGAMEDCLRILETNCRKETKVQVHCFLGTHEEATRWLERFPKTCFSIGPLSAEQGEDHRSALRRLPLQHLLIETDAPYLARHGRQYPGPASPRRDLLFVGQWLAAVKFISPAMVLEVTRLNALEFFMIPGV
jgi:TatD DNase family protein